VLPPAILCQSFPKGTRGEVSIHLTSVYCIVADLVTVAFKLDDFLDHVRGVVIKINGWILVRRDCQSGIGIIE
jgi:hypothetical protein